ncbi:MAG: CBS protein [uncultured bacterium]|nr:MAG: CBS protein [uncultured bacterium]
METAESEKFVALYNQFDNYMRNQLGVGRFVNHSSLLREMSLKNKLVYDFLTDLRMFAEVRNMLIHNPYKKNADPLFYPHAYVTQKYEEIINLILHPPKALSIAIPGSKIYTATPETLIQKIMRTMVEKNYTHVPIIEDGKMTGIFSENILLSYLVTNQEGIILKDATVKDFFDFIHLEKHMNEYFEFVSRNAFLTEVDSIFSIGVKNGKRVAVVYITEHGKSTEKILGMITPWDLTARA